ncbi:uncharacterized protein LOC126187718 [Schistocerca cancellata]|uniref:uncharacterized protein LOC126187718 n=1 Tax=Schistocerca cancellata TaxID=274614 RepID=UPI002117AEC7|nr:uncharacterized protein LOC126187718 [Schistocerca cancellata]
MNGTGRNPYNWHNEYSAQHTDVEILLQVPRVFIWLLCGFNGGNLQQAFLQVSKQPQELLLKWESVCKLSPEVNCASYFVCEDHFFEEDFMNKSRHRLNRGVFPKRVTGISCEIAKISSESGDTVVNSELGLPSTTGAMTTVHFTADNTRSETGVNELQSLSCVVASSSRSGSGETGVNSELDLPSTSDTMENLYYTGANTRGETGVS